MRQRLGALCLLLTATHDVFWAEANPFPDLLDEVKSTIESFHGSGYRIMDNAAEGLEVRYSSVLTKSTVNCNGSIL